VRGVQWSAVEVISQKHVWSIIVGACVVVVCGIVVC
jgi:hypothetical protein